MYIFYAKDDNKLKIFNKEEVVDNLYYLKIRLPTEEDIKKNKNKEINKYFKSHTIDNIKKTLSKINLKIPLYDVYNDNLYIIMRENVYNRVINQYYRIPNEELLNKLIERKKDLDPQIKKIEKKNIQGKIKKMNLSDFEKDKTDYKELHHDIFLQRKHYKLSLMINFLKSYNLEKLHSTYVNIFYHYANEVGKNITLCKRPSFLPHFRHINPYYTRSELINMALNMELIKPNNKYYDAKELRYLCKKVSKNDINSNIILNHQIHIIKNNKIGIVKYYSMQGSYFMNRYLRQLLPYPYKNNLLEKLIASMWKLILSAPKFDKSYIVYRFIKDDGHLNHIKIGDEFITPSFISTTRNPFYSSEEYKFGYILLKIKIPKDQEGVALCIETMSHFPKEEEIILPPGTILKLMNRDENVKYYHTDHKFVNDVNTIYEFNLERRKGIKFKERQQLEKIYNPIDSFLNLNKRKYLSIDERIKQFINENVSPLYNFDVFIGSHKFTITCEWYDSTTAYKKFYKVNTSHGFSMYSIDTSHMEFFIEIGEDEDGSYMYVNYYLKFATTDYKKKYTEEEFIMFLSELAHYFEIQNVIIFADYFSCDLNNEMIEIGKNKNININGNTKIKIYYGGNYCIDYYNYLKYGTKKYKSMDSTEISPGFSYYMLDKLKITKPSEKILEDDNNELFQIYDNTYKRFVKDESNINMAKFFVWIVENHCYLIDVLIKKISKIYTFNNPFEKNYYVLDPEAFLYNRNKIQHYNVPSEKVKEDSADVLVNIPKNQYRLQRGRMRQKNNKE